SGSWWLELLQDGGRLPEHRRRAARGKSLLALGLTTLVGCSGEPGHDEAFGQARQAVTLSSRVLVNQIGYVTSSTKVASVTGSGCNGKTFWVKDGSTTVFTGTTSSAITDPGSGETVCKADFSSFNQTGT